MTVCGVGLGFWHMFPVKRVPKARFRSGEPDQRQMDNSEKRQPGLLQRPEFSTFHKPLPIWNA